MKQFALIIPLLLWAVPAAAGGPVILESKELRATVDLATMSVDVLHKPAKTTWTMSRDGAREYVYESDGQIHEVSLADSKSKTVTRLGKAACSVTFNDFHLEIIIRIDEESGDLFFKLIPLEEDHQFKIKGIVYPRAFDVPMRSDSYSFFPTQQGMMIPGDWPEEEIIGTSTRFGKEDRIKLYGELMNRPSNWWDWQDGEQAGLSGSARMSCFGAVQPGSGFLAQIADNCQMDSHLSLNHTPGQPTDLQVYWLPTMGRLGYPRVISYHFEKDAGYVSLMKYFRAYYKKLGYLKTLAEKNKQNPNVERMRGAISLQTVISHHDERLFQHEVFYTFHELGELVEDFKEKVGAEKAGLGFMGWQRYGHDVQYPDIMPPMMAAGGPLGMDSLSTKVQEMGYLFGLITDNYCDITLDAASFDEEVTLKDSQGKYFRRSTWGAGVNSLICPRWGLRFMKRNFEVGRTDYPPVLGLLETAHPDTYLLGNFVCNWECYDPRHPLTRNENREVQKEFFQYFQDKGILLTIEHHLDWVVPYVVRVRTTAAHKGIYGRDEAGSTRGIPLPLWQLAFHDCAYVNGDSYLYSLLWGARAVMGFPISDDQEQIEPVRLLAQLHEAIGWDQMTDHKFLSEDFRVQETTFSSGAKVWIDLNSGKFKITGVPGIDPVMRQDRLTDFRGKMEDNVDN